jgi:hypothetical protein
MVHSCPVSMREPGIREGYREQAEETLLSHSLRRTRVRLSLIQEVAHESCRRCTNQQYPHQGMNTNCYKYASTRASARRLYDAKQEPQPTPEQDLVPCIFQVHLSRSLPIVGFRIALARPAPPARREF